MSAAKANNNKDTYKATAITLIVFGVLYLADKLLHFSTLGLSWVMNRDNFLLYTAVIFLLFKNDKSVGLVLTGLWLRMSVILPFLTIVWLRTVAMLSISSHVR